MKLPLRIVLFGSLVAVTAEVGCSPDPTAALAALGAGCIINSDCEGELVCVFRRCHVECETSADCDLDSRGDRLRCVVGEPPTNVCQLEDEKYCSLHSDCPGDQVCDSIGECRDECVTDKDCVTEQQCVTAICADAEEINGDGTRLEGADTPPAVGDPCVLNTDCCVDEGDAPRCDLGSDGQVLVCRNAECTIECFADVDCPPFFSCAEVEAGKGGNCVATKQACVPGEQAACACAGGGTGTQVCNAEGTAFEACLDQAGMDCSPP